MKHDSEDRKKLRSAAKVLAEALKRCSTDLKIKVGKLNEADPDGWYVEIAEITTSLSISIWYDSTLCKANEAEITVRGFWVGFTSSEKRVIEELVAANKKIGMMIEKYEEPVENTQVAIEEYRSDGEGDEDEYFKFFGIYYDPGANFDVSRGLGFVCDVLRTIPGFENSVTVDDAALDRVAINCEPDTTTRKQLIDARIGQGDYRLALENLWDGKCAVLGIKNRRLLRASHVKPWRLSNNQERLNPHNGLLLAAHLDALFDAHLITFSADGEMIISAAVLPDDREKLNLGARLRIPPEPELASFLKIHHDDFKARHLEPTR